MRATKKYLNHLCPLPHIALFLLEQCENDQIPNNVKKVLYQRKAERCLVAEIKNEHWGDIEVCDFPHSLASQGRCFYIQGGLEALC